MYAYNAETFGPHGTFGRASQRDVILALDLRAALNQPMLNVQDFARNSAIEDGPTRHDLLLRLLMRGEIAV